MKIAVINETSAGDKNADILRALEPLNHEVLNVGMKQKGGSPELQYSHTGFLSALLLSSGRVDFVIGGCGTGQGFLNSVMQYPGVFCGHILTPLDAMLFARINAGNCISLALNQGYGWASDVNLKHIFRALFDEPFGTGFPPERAEPQRRSREMLKGISSATHREMPELIKDLPGEIVRESLRFPEVLEVLDIPSLPDGQLKTVLHQYGEIA